MVVNFLGQKISVVNLGLILLIGAIMGLVLWCNCAGGVLEGFNAAIDLSGAALDYSMGNGVKGTWEKHEPLYRNDRNTYNDWYNSFENNTGGKVPLPEGQLAMFYDNKSSPDCCPSTYSTSTGCVCATVEQMKYLNSRGGNRTFPTEY